MPVTRQGMTTDAIEELIAQRVTDALATYETNQNTRNGNGNGSGSQFDDESGSRRTVHTARGCTYKEFLNYQPLNFKGSKGVSHVRTVGHDAAYEMSCKDLMKMITEAYCPRIRYRSWKMKLALLCPKMVPKEEDKVERYIWGLPDNIQGNVTSSKPTRLQEAIQINGSESLCLCCKAN
ncbi:hypothetical protein Tco_1000823 [Tanacetum coccineum]